MCVCVSTQPLQFFEYLVRMPSLRGNPTTDVANYHDTNANAGDEDTSDDEIEVENVLSNIINANEDDKSHDTPPPTFDLLYYIAAVAEQEEEKKHNITERQKKPYARRTRTRTPPAPTTTNTMDNYLARSLYTPDISTSIACELSTTGLEPSLSCVSLDNACSPLSSISSLSSRSSSSNSNYYTGIDWNANQNWWNTLSSSSAIGSSMASATTMPARSAGADLLYYQQQSENDQTRESEKKSKKLHGVDGTQRLVAAGGAVPRQQRRHKLSLGSVASTTVAAEPRELLLNQPAVNGGGKREKAKPRYRTKSTVVAPTKVSGATD